MTEQKANKIVSITEVSIQCPADVHKPVDVSILSTPVSWEAPELQGNFENAHVKLSRLPDTEFNQGVTVVTYWVFDLDGRLVTSCNLTVEVHGKQNPIENL